MTTKMIGGKKVDMATLRKVRLVNTATGPQFHSTNAKPLQEGEIVKYDPEDSQYYGKGYSEERAVIGIVGKVVSVDKPYLALGEGETYEEQMKNAITVCQCFAEVAYAESYKPSRLTVAEGSPADWLPGLNELEVDGK